MKREAILNELANRKNGSYICMIVEQDKASMLTAAAKKEGHTLVKSSKVVVRHGIHNIGKMKSYREAYGDKTPGSLPWGHWEVPGIIIGHEAKDGTKKEYLRCYTSGIPASNIYFLDGRQVTYRELQNSGLIKEPTNRGDNTGILCYNIKDIVKILPKRKDRVAIEEEVA